MAYQLLHQKAGPLNGTAKDNEVLSFIEVEVPVPKAHEVLIKVKSVSINPVDYKIVTGVFAIDKKPFPKGCGTDCSGVITAVGATVTTLKVGDEVWSDAITYGAMASYVCVPEQKVGLKPTSMSFNESCSVPLAGLTALQALRDRGSLKKGQNVLIYGGSGGVGVNAIQIAKALGAAVIATTSTNEDLCKRLGATHVVNYKTSTVEEALKDIKFDLIFDAVGGKNYWITGQKVAAKNAIYVSIAGDGCALPLMVGRIVYRKFVSKVFSSKPNYDIFLTDSNAKDLDVLKKFIDDKELIAVLDPTAPFEFTQEGFIAFFAKIMEGRTKGKLVLEVSKGVEENTV